MGNMFFLCINFISSVPQWGVYFFSSLALNYLLFFFSIDIGPQVHHMEFSVHQPMTAVGTDNRHLSSPLLPH